MWLYISFITLILHLLIISSLVICLVIIHQVIFCLPFYCYVSLNPVYFHNPSFHSLVMG